MDVRRLIHHLVAQPLIVLCPPVGEWLAEATWPVDDVEAIGFVQYPYDDDAEPAVVADVTTPILGFRRPPC